MHLFEQRYIEENVARFCIMTKKKKKRIEATKAEVEKEKGKLDPISVSGLGQKERIPGKKEQCVAPPT